MRKFGFKLLIFLGFPILIVVSFEAGIYALKNNLFTEENLGIVYKNDSENYNWIKTIEAEKLNILAGSSSVRYGLSCKILNNLSESGNSYVNMAMDARDPIQTYFILKSLDLENVKNVYFGLDPWIYTKTYYKHRNRYLYLDFSFRETLLFSNQHDKSAFFKRYKSLIAYIFPKNLTKPNKSNEAEIPNDFGSVALKREAKNFNAPACESFELDIYGWSDLQFYYLKKIQQLCNERHIELNVFLPPKRSDYSQDYKINCNTIHKEFVNKLVEIKFNSRIFGKYTQLDKLGDYENFAEAYHLNETGQKLYSEIFYELTQGNKDSFSLEYNWFGN